MIEIIYNKEKEIATGNEEFFCVPKNIRQIGEVPKEYKIYMEDYVYTYLTGDWKTEEKKAHIAILLGKYNWKNKVSYVFIKSAVLADVEEVSIEKDSLTDEVWGKVYEEMKRYFPGQEVVGWCLSLPDSNLRVQPHLIQTHLKHFGGNDKVLLYMDSYERESAFFLYKNSQLEKLKGYYIFYEKNDLMQEYMLAKNPEDCGDYSGKVQDRAVKDFRKIAAKKLDNKSGKEIELSWGHVACAGVAILALTIGTVWVQSQQKERQGVAESVSEETSYMIEETDGMTLLTPEDMQTKEEHREAEREEGDGASQNATENQEPQSVTENQELQSEEDAQNSENVTGSQVLQNTQEDQQSSNLSVYTKYTVRPGDTISQISMRYYGDFSKISEICKINNLLTEDIIYPGQTILLP